MLFTNLLVFLRERSFARKQEIEDASNSPHIDTLSVQPLSVNDIWRSVDRCTNSRREHFE